MSITIRKGDNSRSITLCVHVKLKKKKHEYSVNMLEALVFLLLNPIPQLIYDFVHKDVPFRLNFYLNIALVHLAN